MREWARDVYEVAGDDSGIFLLEGGAVHAADGVTLAGILPLPRHEFAGTLRDKAE